MSSHLKSLRTQKYIYFYNFFFRLQFDFECYQLLFPGADPGFFVVWGAPPELPFDFNFNHIYRV